MVSVDQIEIYKLFPIEKLTFWVNKKLNFNTITRSKINFDGSVFNRILSIESATVLTAFTLSVFVISNTMDRLSVFATNADTQQIQLTQLLIQPTISSSKQQCFKSISMAGEAAKRLVTFDEQFLSHQQAFKKYRFVEIFSKTQ